MRKKGISILLSLLFNVQFGATQVFAFKNNNEGSVGSASSTTTSLVSAGRNVYNFVGTIASMIGLLFIIVGLIKFVMAYMETDGGAEMKASLMIGTGIGLCAFTAILWATLVS